MSTQAIYAEMNHDPNLQTPNGLGSDYPLPSQYERSPNAHSASSSKSGNNVHNNGFSNHGHNHSNGSGNGNGSGMPYPLPDANGQYPPPTWNSYTSSMAPYGTPMHQQFSPSMPPPHHLPPHQLPPFDYIGGSRSAPHLYSGSTRVNGQYVSPTDSRFTTSPFSPMVPLEHLGSYGTGSGSGSGMPPPHPTPYPSRAPVRTPNTRRDERLAATRAGPSQQAGGIRRSASENSEDMSWDGMNNKDEAFDDDSPWGMPQEVYKALPAKEKKQVRNKVGARKFRTKRKLEKKALTAANEAASVEIAALYSHIEDMRKTINSLKAFTGDTDLVEPLPARAFAPPPETPEPESGTGIDTGALGLNVDGHDQR